MRDWRFAAKKSVAILDEIKTWLDAESEIVLPRSPMSKAITYALNQWSALCTYATQGFLNIDNNSAERALKRVALGRKNWLFAGNDQAARSHAAPLDPHSPPPNATPSTRKNISPASSPNYQLRQQTSWISSSPTCGSGKMQRSRQLRRECRRSCRFTCQ